MLQLALALSLLQVDPQQRLRNWDSQLELRDGDGWELEMLRAVPMVEYPYANRKTMMPLIEDLIRYDRQHDHLENQYNVTAYLLNVSNENSNQSAALQEMQSCQPPAQILQLLVLIQSQQRPRLSRPHVAVVGSVVAAPGAVNSTFLANLSSSEIEIFLNSENSLDQRSVWEQNLADLNDFNDLPILTSHYGNLPLKDGQQDNNLFDLQLDAFCPQLAVQLSC
ncbi:Segmentation protein cap'n'collar [Eumeta japonica]|uniref:Segmentation protein cap'n'collar n=1 Tax=Eumeta variegata TaxID=151549 RepID=A0A4C1T7I3_EUMVA|nr:Segmentation protein cap'n'collar [Eumeta japonica]